MSEQLIGKRVAILIAPAGSEQVEFEEPKRAAEEAGAEVTVVSTESGSAQAMKGDTEKGDSFEVDKTFADVSAEDFDALIIPGGTVGADKLRASKEAIRFAESFFAQAKPVAAICHAPWLLVEAGVVNGRKLTSYPSLKTDIKNAGGDWMDQEVVVDGGLITSRNPDDLPAFCNKLVEVFGEAR